MKLTTKCPHCGETMYKVINKGPHRQLNCYACKRYIKFISAEEESYLAWAGHIINAEDKWGQQH